MASKGFVVVVVFSFSFGCCSAMASSPDDLFDLQRYSSQQLEGMRRASKVERLPGQPAVSFHHYSGYVGVNASHGRALFYWFMQAPSPSNNKPLVLWLNGGPGCSSIGYGAAQELGPFRVNKDGTGLDFNQYAWNQEANMLFLDSPIGVGFSYSNDTTDPYNYGDKLTAEEAYIFLISWFKIFPEFMSSDFYMTGESYAGHYVPQLASLIYDRNNDSTKYPRINLKGFMVGNPSTDDFYDWVGIVDYAWSHAIISDDLYANIKTMCDFSQVNWSTSCLQNVRKVFVEYHKIDIYNLYEPICTSNNSSRGQANLNMQHPQSGAQQRRRFSPRGYDACLDEHTIKYFNMREVQEALHANLTGVIPYPWTICSDLLLDHWKDSEFSILPIYRKLIDAGLRIWVYSGDVDGRIPVTSTRYTLNSLHLPIINPWHAWYHNSQVGGWTEELKGVMYVTIRGAGHMVPRNSPSKALTLFSAFLNNLPLPTSITPP